MRSASVDPQHDRVLLARRIGGVLHAAVDINAVADPQDRGLIMLGLETDFLQLPVFPGRPAEHSEVAD